MIESFYALREAPFRLTADERFFFAAAGHRRALAYLEYGLAQGEGFVVLSGEVGSGKSTVVGRLLADGRAAGRRVVRLTSAALGPCEVLAAIAQGLGADVAAGADKPLLLRLLEGRLADGDPVLLIVDEAQNLPVGALEELRMLTNLEAPGRSGLQVFLIGQPQLAVTLAGPELEQLAQRVVGSCHLGPLAADETRAYVLHRLGTAGWDGRPALADDLFPGLHAAAAGIPRRINLVMTRLLLHGALEQAERLDAAALGVVLDDLGDELAALPAATEPVAREAALGRRLARVETVLAELIEAMLPPAPPDAHPTSDAPR